jgi:hypothetical protein
MLIDDESYKNEIFFDEKTRNRSPKTGKHSNLHRNSTFSKVNLISMVRERENSRAARLETE